MEQRAEVRQLWSDYTTYWLQTSNIQKLRASGRPVRSPKLTPDRYKLFEQLYDWCVERELDPRLWLFILFRSRRWMFAPQLSPGHLMSEKLLASGRYQKVVESGALDGYRLYTKGPQKGADPNRDVIHGAEQRKRVYLKNGQANLCMALIMSDTYGYHPKSQWCQKCPKKVECQNLLQRLVKFDILALRRGEITAEEARAQANA
jgi:hypothetical protein